MKAEAEAKAEAQLAAARAAAARGGTGGSWCSSTEALPVNGETFYVSPNGADGSCDQAKNAGTPLRTIAQAMGCMKPGDTLLLRGGEYNEAIRPEDMTIPSGNSWEEAITIAGYPGERAVIKGVALNSGMGVSYLVFDNLVIDGGVYAGTDNHHIRVNNSDVFGHNENYMANYEEIKRQYEAWGKNDGYNFMQWTNHFGTISVISGPADYLEVTNSKIHDGFYGAYVNGSHMLFEGNEVYDNIGAYGLHVYSSSGSGVGDNVFRNNAVHDNGGYDYRGMAGAGIVLSSGSNNVAENNHIYNNAGGGIEASWGCNGCTIANNTIENNGGAGIGLVASPNTTVRDNRLSSNGGGEVADYDGSGAVVTGNGAGAAGADMAKVMTSECPS
jgi:parallel beta-helix repeat protein